MSAEKHDQDVIGYDEEMLVSGMDPIEALFQQDENFRKVLAQGMSLSAFTESSAFQRLRQIAQERFPDMDKLSKITEEDVICAWIAKIRFNEHMSDQAFYQHIQKGDKILSGEHTVLNFKGESHLDNDNISLMWGLQALAGAQGYDNGAIRVRLPPTVAPRLFQAFKESGGKERVSTHAALTSIDYKGMGKDLFRDRDRLYTPMGYGTLLLHRTFANDENAVSYAQGKAEAIQDHDMLFKMEDIGMSDRWDHTLMHLLGPLKAPFMRIGSYDLFHTKSSYAKRAEQIEGHFEKISRKDHLSALGKKNASDLIQILKAIQQDTSDAPDKKAFDGYMIKRAFRVKLPWPFENKIVGRDGVKCSLGGFVETVSQHESYIRNMGHGDAFDRLAEVRRICQGPLASRREGLEVIIDASSTTQSANVLPVGDLLKEPKLKTQEGFLTRLWRTVQSALGLGTSYAPVVPTTRTPVNVSLPDSLISPHIAGISVREVTSSSHAIPSASKHTQHDVLEKIIFPLDGMIKAAVERGILKDSKALLLSNMLQEIAQYTPSDDVYRDTYQKKIANFYQIVQQVKTENDLPDDLKNALDGVIKLMQATADETLVQTERKSTMVMTDDGESVKPDEITPPSQ